MEWASETGGVVCSSPAISNGVVYFSCSGYANHVLALDIQLAETRRSTQVRLTQTRNRASSSPVISRGAAYFGTSKGLLCAVDSRSGEQEWVFATGKGVHSSPAIGGAVYFGSDDGCLYAVK